MARQGWWWRGRWRRRRDPTLFRPPESVRVEFPGRAEVGAGGQARALALGRLDEGLAVSLHADVAGGAGRLLVLGGDAGVAQLPAPVARAVGSVALHRGDG